MSAYRDGTPCRAGPRQRTGAGTSARRGGSTAADPSAVAEKLRAGDGPDGGAHSGTLCLDDQRRSGVVRLLLQGKWSVHRDLAETRLTKGMANEVTGRPKPSRP